VVLVDFVPPHDLPSAVASRPQDKEGAFQSSPPKDLDKLYKMGPPAHVYIESKINALKQAQFACGVYNILLGEDRPWIRGSESDNNVTENGQPIWKHSTEDLCLTYVKFKAGEEGWAVCKWSTLATKKHITMRVLTGGSLPFGKSLVWQEWDGRDFVPAASVKCRPSWHGWGTDKLDRSRLKFAPGSPGGAY
jgi:hypothetical protein